MTLLCRVAENLFWMSRYVERAIATIRVIDVTAHLELDAGDPHSALVDFWMPLLGTGTDELPGAGSDSALPQPHDVRYFLAFDTDNPNSLVSSVRHARAAAREVRDSLSSEIWEQINTTYLMLNGADRVRDMEENLHSFYRVVRDNLLLIQAHADATMAHDESYAFLTLGLYLERADALAGLLRVEGHLLVSSLSEPDEDTVRWLSVLRSAGSAEAYSRYYSLRVDPTRVLEFLLLNSSFPQSVRYSLGAAWAALHTIARTTDEGAAPPVRALGLLRARLEHASVDEVIEFGLEDFLTSIQVEIGTVSERITRTYFRYTPHVSRHMAATRAAQIMAAQHQQQ